MERVSMLSMEGKYRIGAIMDERKIKRLGGIIT